MMDNLITNLQWLPKYSLTTSRAIPKKLKLAYSLAQSSPDPNTKNGAVLFNTYGQEISTAFNTLPDQVEINSTRMNDHDLKLCMIVHAENGAILQAAKRGLATDGGTLYCPFYACAECSKAIIQAGIKRVVGHAQLMALASQHTLWHKSIRLGFEMMFEAGVQCDLYNGLLNLQTRFNRQDVNI